MYPNPAVAPAIVWEGSTFSVAWQVIDPTTGLPATAPVVTGAVTLPDGSSGGAMTITPDVADASIVRATYTTTMDGTHAYLLTSVGPAQVVQGVAIARTSAGEALPIELDPATATGRVRLLITDVDPSSPIFTDAQIGGFVGLAPGGSVYIAAALALETIAASEVLISKKITTQDLATDGPAVAKELRMLAERLRKNAAEVDENGDVFAIEIVPFDPCPGVGWSRRHWGW